MAGARVCVSGVTGFLGAQIVKDLMAKGYGVNGCARRCIADPSRVAHLTSLPSASTAFKAFEADLTTPNAYDSAMEGCTYAIHCASPYSTDSSGDPYETYVRPAVEGTKSFLESVKKAGTIRRVIVTSSCAAVGDCGTNGKALTEDDWNTQSNTKRLPYYYSKVMAEKAAWEWAEKNPSISLVVINPFLIIGPSMVKSVNESNNLMKSIAEGSALPGVVDLSFTIVDVRDVSKAHLLAMETESASGRYICANSQQQMHLRDIVRIQEEMGFKPKKTSLEHPIISTIIRGVSSLARTDTQAIYTRNHIANPLLVSNEKIMKDLGMTFSDVEQTLRETMDDMVAQGHMKKPESS